jgi:hypothetical protein
MCACAFCSCAQTADRTKGFAKEPSVGEIAKRIKAPSGWQLASKPMLYVGEKLCDHIDGDAARFFESGFRLAAIVEWKPSAKGMPFGAGDRIAAELYEMDSPRGAFAIFSQDRSGSPPFFKVGVVCAFSDNWLSFIVGNVLARVSFQQALSAEDSKATPEDSKVCEAAVTASVLEAGHEIEKALRTAYGMSSARETTASDTAQGGQLPSMLDLLPADGLVAGSERYFIGRYDPLGTVAQAVEADYTVGGGRAKLFLAEYASATEAAEAYAGVRDRIRRPVLTLARRESFCGEDSFLAHKLPVVPGSGVETPAHDSENAQAIDRLCFHRGRWIGGIMLGENVRFSDYPRTALVLDWLLRRVASSSFRNY